MKKGIFFFLVAAVFCLVLTSCGETEPETTTSSTTRDYDTTFTTANGMMNGTPEEEMNTVSEWFSEGMSDLRDDSFLDPDNGIVSDTNPAD